jgi:hypothetical protein
MKTKLLTVLFILVLVAPFFVNSSATTKATSDTQDLYVGIDVAYESVPATEALIDKVSAYTNIFIIGCSGNRNETRLNVLSQYIVDKGMSFIVYTDNRRYPTAEWLANADSKYGDKFLGIYNFDEEGGKQLDQQNFPAVTSATDYADAANQYNTIIQDWLRGKYSITQSFAYPGQFNFFTSDYALYWYDYKAGYDTVFAEFGWNYSRQLNVALCRGAATAYGKDWGVIITWTYKQPPYIESGADLYNDMVLAYQNGAKYIIVFDTNEGYTQSILTQEHLNAIQKFWQYVQNHPRTITPLSNRTAYVLPENYAYGFRGGYDKIWGLWGPDELTTTICMNVSSLLINFGQDLDMVYPDSSQSIDSLGYGRVLTWNSQQLSDSTATPTQTASPNPSSSSMQNSFQTEFYLLAGIAGFAVVAVVSVAVLKLRRKT